MRCEHACGFAVVDGSVLCAICADERHTVPETSLAVLNNAWPDGFTCDSCHEVVHFHGTSTDE